MPSSGSTSTAARCAASFAMIFSHASASFQGSTITCLRTSPGIPLEARTGFGRRRLPAAEGSGATLTSTESWVPW